MKRALSSLLLAPSSSSCAATSGGANPLPVRLSPSLPRAALRRPKPKQTGLDRPLQLSYQNADMSMVPKVVDMLMCNFLYDEPINQALKLHTEKFFLEDFVVAGMAEGLTMVAMDNETGKILGVIISGVVSRADHNIPLSVKLADIMDFNFRHLIALLHNVNEVAGESVFDGLPQDTFSEIYDMKLLSTDRSVRQEGVATHLVRSAVTDAQKRGFKRVKCEATNDYSRRVAENVGLRVLAEYPYSSYTDSNGIIFPELAKKHRCLSLMTRDLS